MSKLSIQLTIWTKQMSKRYITKSSFCFKSIHMIQYSDLNMSQNFRVNPIVCCGEMEVFPWKIAVIMRCKRLPVIREYSALSSCPSFPCMRVSSSACIDYYTIHGVYVVGHKKSSPVKALVRKRTLQWKQQITTAHDCLISRLNINFSSKFIKQKL